MAVRSPLFDIFDPYQTLSAGMLPEMDEEIDPIGLIPIKRRPQISDLMPEEEKRGMLRRLADIGASGVSSLGWLLDTPGAFVRGTISGLASGDPLRGVRDIAASSDDRVSGRELARQFNLAGPEDNWMNWVGGFATELATDPLTLLNPAAILGRGAYGAAGKIAKSGNLLQDAALLAKNQGKGVRQFLRESTPQSLIDTLGGDAAERFARAAQGAGYEAADLMDQPLAGLMEARLPFMHSGALISGGSAGDFLAKSLDKLGEAAKVTPGIGPIVNRATAAFDPSVLGEIDPQRQWTMRRASALGRDAVREEYGRLGKLNWEAASVDASALPEGLNSFASPRIQNAIRDLVEAGGDEAKVLDKEAVAAVLSTPQWNKVYEEFASRGPEFQRRAKGLGLDLATWTGESGDQFFPSQSVWFDNPLAPDLPDRLKRTENPYTRGSRVLGIDDNLSRRRDPAYDLQQRAQTFRRLQSGDYGRELQDRLMNATDNQIPAIIDEAFQRLKGETPDFEIPFQRGQQELIDFLADPTLAADQRKLYQGKLDTLVAAANAKKVKLGDLLRKSDRQFSANNMGLFDESAFDSMSRYSAGRARVESNARVITDELLGAASEVGPGDVPGGGWIRLDQAAKDLGFDPTELRKVIQSTRGKDITNYSVNEKVVASLKKLRPDPNIAEDSVLSRAYRTFTNAFKIGALANPAYHFRNLYSGQLATATGGPTTLFDAAMNAYAGLRAGQGNYKPLLSRLRNAPGYAGKTDDEILAQFMEGIARNRLSMGEFADLASPIEQATTTALPGVGYRRTPWVGQGGLLYDPERTWREWSTVRGVDWSGILTDREAPKRTLNPLLRLHERAGQSVENANRLGAYLQQIRQGADPDEAANLVYKTQVDYRPEAFTDFERGLKSAIPFYSYPRGIAGLVGENLLYRPGGLQGQSIRAVSLGSRPTEEFFTPEYLRQSAAIPLPGMAPADNLQRFLTNIDLPYEGLVNLFSPGIGNTATQRFTDSLQKTGMNLLGQLNPVYKAPLEMVLNRQLYTGRELSDLYSVLERDIGPMGRPIEQIVTNFVPGGTKLTSIYRTATDSRLSAADRALKLLINNTVGAKVTDVDQERTRRLAARNTLNELLSTTPGVRTYENITVPEDVLRAMPREQQQMYLLYKIIQSEAAKRARDKKKAQAAIDPMQLLGIVS